MDEEVKKIFMSFPIVSAICQSAGYSFEDMWYLSKDNVMNCSIKLICEICDLIEEGYTYDDIYGMIENSNFEGFGLSDDEKSYLKKDAAKTLKIKFGQKGEKNNE